ncbi:PadR family transcriptional regulator [Stakelama sp. CBK3Z-3]|uniref:PadR family transcriptional regulator n=2 Tax=Stakelama flava TaxID=2860338 RepID=A0ABS6XHD2_9SPHN|nr:PadR family transcriptional regulator [Stakelama flava]
MDFSGRGWGPRGGGMPRGGEWRDEGGRGGGRGRGRRMFDGGELRLVLLKLIADQPRHGYDLIREIEERTGGAYAPSPGVVYPTVTMLGDMDLIAEQESEGAKKIYAITETGTAHLEENAEVVAALMARLEAVASMRARTNAGPVKRAMVNLRTVLQQRLTDDETQEDTLHDVAEIIDEAARKIERL